ncbi:hypothetical protein BpHYR1_021772 [Brachionus plicatilis]|uniref:Uncharacterized protein n=1 Tax=Brachionus plicatilis TaxID=10195 RepID=A0A3M7SXH9_BRAPC|nr:hypothetical protein BpHYR1_021772 [Brachionus plicatilis]
MNLSKTPIKIRLVKLIIKKSTINHHFSVYLIQSTPILASLLMSIPALIDNSEIVTKLLNFRDSLKNH